MKMKMAKRDQVAFVVLLVNSIGVLCCNFDGLIASCRMSVGGVPLEVSARINHCHTPIDVTYVVQSDTKLLQSFDRKGNPEEDESEDDPINITESPYNTSAKVSWRYTYVTTNQPESQEIPGFGRRVLLHLLANTASKPDFHSGVISKKLSLKAQFLVDGQTNEGLKFIDETIRIPHFEDCLYTKNEQAVSRIVIGCLVSLLIIALIAFGIYYWWTNNYASSDDEVNLVSNMERSQATPKLEETVDREIERIPMDEVLYVVPSQSCQTCEDDEPKVYISTSTGFKKVERKHSQNSDRSNFSNKSSQLKEIPINWSQPVQKIPEKSTSSNGGFHVKSKKTESIQSSEDGCSSPDHSRPVSKLSETTRKISNVSDTVDSLSTFSNRRPNLDSSISSSSEISLPVGLSPSSSRSDASIGDRPLGAIPKRRISPDSSSSTTRSSTRSSTLSDASAAVSR